MGWLSDLFGGGGDDAYQQMRADEEKRRAEIKAAQQRIEGIFSSPARQQQYADYVTAQRGYLQNALDRSHKDNVLQTKFATARSGLSGGSVDVDRNRKLAELYLQGIAEAERKAQNSGAELMAQDQQAKQQLFSSILAGGDTTTAAQNAAQMIRTNSALAKQDSYVNAFDSLFGGFGDLYKRSREDAGERRASQEFGSLFGPRTRTTANVAGGVYG